MDSRKSVPGGVARGGKNRPDLEPHPFERSVWQPKEIRSCRTLLFPPGRPAPPGWFAAKRAYPIGKNVLVDSSLIFYGDSRVIGRVVALSAPRSTADGDPGGQRAAP